MSLDSHTAAGGRRQDGAARLRLMLFGAAENGEGLANGSVETAALAWRS